MKYFLFLLAILEVLLISYLGDFAGPYITPVIFLGTSITIALLYLNIKKKAFPSINKNIPTATSVNISPLQRIISLSLFIISSGLIFIKTIHIFHAMPLGDVGKSSDIIPQVVQMVQHLLKGETPYQIIHFSGYDLFPTYQPMQWLPYTIAAFINIDYRWIPVMFLELSCLYFYFKTSSQNNGWFANLIIPVWPLIVWGVLLRNDDFMFSITVEALMASYYLLVVTSIKNRNVLLLAIGISLCLLSRYSIVLWVPFCVLAYYFHDNKKQALVITGIIALSFILIYWMPFLSHDHTIFIKGYQYHSAAAYEEWKRGRQMSGYGLASWSNGFTWLDLKGKLELLQKIHFSFSLLSIVILFVIFIKNGNKYPFKAYLLFSLKAYLTVFYIFIQIPYKYLYFVPVIITSVLIADAFNCFPANKTRIAIV